VGPELFAERRARDKILDAIALADQMIQAGEYDIVVAGGMES
jgi:acetyl-CoA acetyltransferase